MMPQLGEVPLMPATPAAATSAARTTAVAVQTVPLAERLYLISPVALSCQVTTTCEPVQKMLTASGPTTFEPTRLGQVVHWALTVGSVIFCTSSVPLALERART